VIELQEISRKDDNFKRGRQSGVDDARSGRISPLTSISVFWTTEESSLIKLILKSEWISGRNS